jgi:hypothetical protein
MVAATFHSKAKLNLLSNYFKVSELPKSDGKERGKLIQHYDDTKRASDKFNFMVKFFHNFHSHSTPDLSILNGWIEWGLTNGYILYKTNVESPLTQKIFRKNL